MMTERYDVFPSSFSCRRGFPNALVDSKITPVTSHQRQGVSNHLLLGCLFTGLFRLTTKVTAIPVASGFPPHRANNIKLIAIYDGIVIPAIIADVICVVVWKLAFGKYDLLEYWWLFTSHFGIRFCVAVALSQLKAYLKLISPIW